METPLFRLDWQRETNDEERGRGSSHPRQPLHKFRVVAEQRDPRMRVEFIVTVKDSRNREQQARGGRR